MRKNFFFLPCLTLAKSHIRGAVTRFLSKKDIAIGPDCAPVRAWHSWGDCAHPLKQQAAKQRRRNKPPRWLFSAPLRRFADDIVNATDAQDGRRLTFDEGQPENRDLLLERLREVHGEARPDLFAGRRDSFDQPAGSSRDSDCALPRRAYAGEQCYWRQ